MKVTHQFEAKIELAASALPPDVFVGGAGDRPTASFIVSRHPDGTVASRYEDVSWDWTPYSNDGRNSPLNFKFWKAGVVTAQRKSLLGEMRWLLFLVIYARDGNALAYSSYHGYVGLLRALARYCDSTNLTLAKFLSDERLLVDYIASAMVPHMAEYLSPLLALLRSLDKDVVGFNVPGKTLIARLHALIQRGRARQKQTAPIPTRIYSALITALAQELDDFEAVAEHLLALAQTCAQGPTIGRAHRTQRQYAQANGIKRKGYHPSFEELLEQYDRLGEYFEAKALNRSVLGLAKALGQIQVAAKFMVHVFSGMRDDEVTSLPYDCIQHSVRNGKSHYLIAGSTTKLSNGKLKQARWVTSKEGHRAVLIAQRIADTVYRFLNITPDNSCGTSPLFISLTYLNLAGHVPLGSRKTVLPSLLYLGSYPELQARLRPVIEDSDIMELEQIDPMRNWRAEKQFQLGQPWELATHQLRRSLALYAQRSGLVSLPTLRRQLQHITREMSQYYAKGSQFARNLIGDDKDHFGNEWQDASALSSALSYMANVIFSDVKLFGGHGAFVEHRLRKDDTSATREDILLKFKRGQIAYKETPLGGCVKVGECTKVGFRMLDVDCLAGCKNLVGMLPKLDRVIAAQTRLVGSLKPDSIEFRMEKSDLEALTTARCGLTATTLK